MQDGFIGELVYTVVVMEPAGHSAVRGVGTNTYLISRRRKEGWISPAAHTPTKI